MQFNTRPRCLDYVFIAICPLVDVRMLPQHNKHAASGSCSLNHSWGREQSGLPQLVGIFGGC